jgi:hypothetical protein
MNVYAQGQPGTHPFTDRLEHILMDTIAILGIDVAKKTFYVALHQNGKVRRKQFANNAQGFTELAAWLRKLRYSPLSRQKIGFFKVAPLFSIVNI